MYHVSHILTHNLAWNLRCKQRLLLTRFAISNYCSVLDSLYQRFETTWYISIMALAMIVLIRTQQRRHFYFVISYVVGWTSSSTRPEWNLPRKGGIEIIHSWLGPPQGSICCASTKWLRFATPSKNPKWSPSVCRMGYCHARLIMIL